jgi:hypothetical protein
VSFENETPGQGRWSVDAKTYLASSIDYRQSVSSKNAHGEKLSQIDLHQID